MAKPFNKYLSPNYSTARLPIKYQSISWDVLSGMCYCFESCSASSPSFQDLFKLSKHVLTECTSFIFSFSPLCDSVNTCAPAGGRHLAVFGPGGWLGCPWPEQGRAGFSRCPVAECPLLNLSELQLCERCWGRASQPQAALLVK